MTLLHIPDWDLDWQDDYFFKEKLVLPAGTVITSEIHYDNSADNPDNPFSPPRRIKWGRESTDEMGSITLSVVPVDGTKDRKLRTAVAGKNASMVVDLLGELRSTTMLERLPRIIKHLDRNGDGDLQKSELPSRFGGRLFNRLDVDKNDILDASEIQTLKDWLKSLENRKKSSHAEAE